MVNDSLGTVVKHFFGGKEKEEIAYDDKFVDTCEQKIIVKEASLHKAKKKSKKF